MKLLAKLKQSNRCKSKARDVAEGKKMQDELIKYIEDNKAKHYRMAYSYVHNQEDALDIIQDTIIKALKHVEDLKDQDYLGTWFCRILINTCKDHLKKQKQYVSIEEANLSNSSSMDRDQVLDMEDALNKLATNEKTVVLLRYYEQLELQEIARVMEQNLSTVKSTLYRTVKKLKGLLE